MSGQGYGSKMPEAELQLTPELATRLLADQHPDLAGLPLSALSRGWDNTMFRVGGELTIRLPHRALAEELLVAEQRWLPELGPKLPLPIPVPVRIGVPTEYYPWHWSVLRWFDGLPVGTEPNLDGGQAASDLGRFLAALHHPAPPDAPTNDGRGCPLSARNEITLQRIDALDTNDSPFDQADRNQLRRRWADYLTVAEWQGPAMWLHGDLHAMNVLHHERRINAVIDFGDITDGDPATDLAIGFAIFDRNERERFRAAADTAIRPIDDAMWARAEAWAMSVGLAIINSSSDSPAMFRLGRRMLNLS